MNTKLHAVADADGRPIRLFMTAGQVSDYTGAAALLDSLPKADWLLANRGYDADWFRDALKDKGIKPSIPGRKSRGKPIKHDKRRYKRRNRIEIMFGRLKDWRRVGEDVTEELEYVPGRFIVNRIVRPRLTCTCYERFVQAPLPSRPIERGRPGPGLLAHVLVSKCADHLPLCRQSQIFDR